MSLALARFRLAFSRHSKVVPRPAHIDARRLALGSRRSRKARAPPASRSPPAFESRDRRAMASPGPAPAKARFAVLDCEDAVKWDGHAIALARLLGRAGETWEHHRCWSGELPDLREIHTYQGLVVTGSHYCVRDEHAHEWIEAHVKPHLVKCGCGVEVLVKLLETDKHHVAEAIIEESKKVNASDDNSRYYEAIVLASHKRGAIKEFFLGSVANYVLHHSNIAVVVQRLK